MHLKHKNIGLAAILIGGLGFISSCSDEEMSSKSNALQEVKAKIEVNNNPSELDGRIELYTVENRVLELPQSRTCQTRAIAEPPVPSDAKDMADKAFNPQKPAGDKFVLKEGVEATMNLNLNNAYWYVKGDLTLNNVSGKGRIFVLNGGRLSYPDHLDEEIQIYTYIGGKFEFRGDNLSLKSGSIFHTQGDMQIPGILDVQGFFAADGYLEAGEIRIYNMGMSNVVAGLEVASKTSVTEGRLDVLGSFVSPELKVAAGSYIYSGCKGVFEKGLSLADKSTYYSEYYIESPVTKIESGAVLQVQSGGLLDLGALEISDATIEVYGSNYAVVTTKSITVDRSDLRNLFKGNMGLHYKGNIKGVDDQSKLEFLANVKINGEDDTVIEESGCRPGYTPETSPDKDSGASLEHIAQISSPEDHEHYLSATSVQQSNDKVYVSYHRNGAEYSGCAEVFKFDSEYEISLVSYMRPTEACDFNHLIVDDGNVFLTGGDKKGGFLASLPLSGDGTYQGGESSMSVIRLGSNDANCVVRNGNYYQVAATDGFHIIDATNKILAARKETSGSAKYISMSNDQTVTLNLASRRGDQSGAEINVYNRNDYTLTSPRFVLDDAVITPLNGKNVCLSDNTDIYVALGGNGLRRYTNGAANGEFKLNGNARVNGLDYDEKYIYVAYGEKGLRILDKQTLNEIASYTHSGGKSANFVKVVNGYIFVAYGLNGLQVFRLTEK